MKPIDRRTFIKAVAGSGALIATSSLPSFAEDKPEVFPQRGAHERLALCYAVVNLGLKEPFSVLHISDTHLTAVYSDENKNKRYLGENRTVTFGGRQEEALRDSIAWAKENDDYLIHTGDLIDWQSRANFDLVHKYFGENMIGSIGNHEFTPEMWLSEPKESNDEAFKDNTRELLQSAYPFNITFHSQIARGVNFITLDDIYGYVTEKQVTLFKEEVKKGIPIVLCMHVPFYSEAMWRFNTRFWNGKGPYRDAAIPQPSSDYQTQIKDPVTRDFITYLKKEPLLKAILAGHTHFPFEEQFSPTAVQLVVGANFTFSAREILFI